MRGMGEDEKRLHRQSSRRVGFRLASDARSQRNLSVRKGLAIPCLTWHAVPPILAIENGTECRNAAILRRVSVNLIGTSAESELDWRTIMRLTRPLLLGVIGISVTGYSVVMKCETGPHDNWVETWAAAPMAHPNKSGMFATDTTLRQIVHVSVGGSAIRVVLTNEFGTADLRLGGASVAVPLALPSANVSNTESSKPADQLKGNSAVAVGSIVPIRFGGQNGTTVAPGAIASKYPPAEPGAFQCEPLEAA